MKRIFLYLFFILFFIACNKDNNKGPFEIKAINDIPTMLSKGSPASGIVKNKGSEVEYENGIPTGKFKVFSNEGKLVIEADTQKKELLYEGKIKVYKKDGKFGLLEGSFAFNPVWIMETSAVPFISPVDFFDLVCVNGRITSSEIKGEIKNRVKEGLWEKFHDNGSIAIKGNFSANLPQGVWEIYYPNGNLQAKGEYIDGEKNGPWILNFENGKLKWKENFSANKYDGQQKYYYEDGKLEVIESYKNGVAHGTWEKYYPNGQLETKGNFVDGHKNGIWNSYYKNGNLHWKENYVSGEPIGVWEVYSQNGQLEKTKIMSE